MSEQLELVPAPTGGAPRRRARTPASDVPLAAEDPVATVLVDTPLAHLDRPFEYAVPADLAQTARPGVRVRVRFAGRDHDGFLLSRTSTAEHTGRLAPLRSVVSPEPVLTPEVLALARQVADHYGGTLADTVRLAVPPRHARAERSVPSAGEAADRKLPDGGWEQVWAPYPAGAALLRRLRSREAPAAAWLALPGMPPEGDWPRAVAAAVRETLLGGRGSLVVLPDRRDVERVLPAIVDAVGEQEVVRLTADLGPEARYAAFLRALRGHARVVVGTRASAFAPVRDLGLVVCWDEGDDLHQEPRAPYPHARETLRLRARDQGAGLLLGGFTRSVAVQRRVADGELATVVAAHDVLRQQAPSVVVGGEGHQEDRDAAARTARLPGVAVRALRSGLERGPVLVQVPRQGYVLGLACQDCRARLRCGVCHGPVGAGDRRSAASCRWCGTELAADHPCEECGSRRRRTTGVGDRRTAEELGRAFPGTRVVSSGGDHVVDEVDGAPALVVATPGAEPWCPAGYAAVVLVDGWRLLERASLDAAQEALRRWCGAAALARPATTQGRRAVGVVLCGVPPHGSVPAVEALVRWDPAWLADRELADRAELGLPPLVRHVEVSGPTGAVDEVGRSLVAAGLHLLGTLRSDDGPDTDPQPRVRATLRQGTGEAARAVRAVRADRSARKAQDVVRIRMDADGAV